MHRLSMGTSFKKKRIQKKTSNAVLVAVACLPYASMTKMISD
jgi:hypothetical protein